MKSFTTVLFAFSILIIGITQGAFDSDIEDVEDLRKELKDLKEIDKEFMSKVLSRLEINDDENIIQDEKIVNLEAVQVEVENLQAEVIKQGEILNDTKKAVVEQYQQLKNLTEILGKGQDEEKEEENPDSEKPMDSETMEDSASETQSSAQGSDMAEKTDSAENPEMPKIPKYKCPTDKKNYMEIDKTCYYFDIARKKFGDALLKCKQVFDNSTKGRIFEPRTIERNDKVLEATKEFTGGKSFNYWLGITDENEEGKYQYKSDDKFLDENFGDDKPGMPWFKDDRTEEPNGGKGANCVYGFARNLKWFDFRCARSRVYSICELPVIGVPDRAKVDQAQVE